MTEPDPLIHLVTLAGREQHGGFTSVLTGEVTGVAHQGSIEYDQTYCQCQYT